MELPKYESLMQMAREKLDEVEKSPVALAEEIKVDPSTVNRYLNGKTEAPYENLRAIWRVLREWEDEQRQPATELMTEGFTSTTLNETCGEAAAKMRDGEFSQLPVRETEDGEVSGIITDTDLMRVHDSQKPVKDIEPQHVIEVDKDEDRQLIEKILEEGHPAVLVFDDGTPVGIITKADLLESILPTA